MLYSRTIGTGPDLVLLHGWGFNSELFNDLIEQYKGQYRITVVDLPGHGRSNDIDGGLDKWCDEIIKILPKNPILMGWSLGGLLAIKIATKIAISKLILVASTPNFVQTNDWPYGINENNFRQFSDALEFNLSKGLKRFVSLQTQDKTHLKTLIQSIDKFPASAKALNQGLEILLTTDLVDELNQLKIPIEVILGNHDTLVPYRISNWYDKAKIKTQVLNAGHLPFLHKDFTL
jgi:pimeloyl-[acyl-carrier protein] methyl ester esterase